MPTTRPRYTITDTGSIRGLLDDAQRQWPDVRDRKQLLVRLAEAGHESLQLGSSDEEMRKRREHQSAALERLRSVVDWDSIRDDRPWR